MGVSLGQLGFLEKNCPVPQGREEGGRRREVGGESKEDGGRRRYVFSS